MTAAGWVLMIGSVGGVVAWTAYCFYRVLSAPRVKGHIHAPLEIDTDEKLE
jgi:hypothetical protein